MIIFKEQMEYAFWWADGGKPPETKLSKTFEHSELGFGSTQQGMLFLRRFSELMEFRQLLSLRYPGQVSKWRLDEIYGKLASELIRKRLRVIKRWIPAEGPVRIQPPSLFVPRRAAVDFSEAPEPPTFLSNHNGEAQAENLASAANDGEPFCEECEKARNAPRAFTGIPESEAKETDTFSDDHDSDTQSEALVTAGTDGVPFCEECEKLKEAELKLKEVKKKRKPGESEEDEDEKDEDEEPESRSRPKPKKDEDEPEEGSEAKAGLGQESQTQQELTWIEICLIDAEGKPVPNVPYKLVDTRNDEREGLLDNTGRARIDGIPPGTCRVTFPTLDQDAWAPA